MAICLCIIYLSLPKLLHLKDLASWVINRYLILRKLALEAEQWSWIMSLLFILNFEFLHGKSSHIPFNVLLSKQDNTWRGQVIFVRRGQVIFVRFKMTEHSPLWLLYSEERLESIETKSCPVDGNCILKQIKGTFTN